MTTWAPDTTKRVIETYVSAGVTHRLMLRRARGESLPTALTNARSTFVNLVTEIANFLPDDFHWVKEEYILEDSNIALPSGWTGPGSIVGAVDADSLTAIEKATAMGFVGKGSGGALAKIFIFGVTVDQHTVGADGADGRIAAIEDADVADAIVLLNSGNPTYAIDNTIASFYAYANIKVNDYWLRQARKGGL